MRSSHGTLPDTESAFAAFLLFIFPDIFWRSYKKIDGKTSRRKTDKNQLFFCFLLFVFLNQQTGGAVKGLTEFKSARYAEQRRPRQPTVVKSSGICSCVQIWFAAGPVITVNSHMRVYTGLYGNHLGLGDNKSYRLSVSVKDGVSDILHRSR